MYPSSFLSFPPPSPSSQALSVAGEGRRQGGKSVCVKLVGNNGLPRL